MCARAADANVLWKVRNILLPSSQVSGFVEHSANISSCSIFLPLDLMCKSENAKSYKTRVKTDGEEIIVFSVIILTSGSH